MTLFDEITTDAPTVWYRFENAADATVNVGSTAFTTVVNGAVTSVPGITSISPLALQTGTTNSYIRATMGTSTLLRPSTSWTVEMWFKRTNATETTARFLLYRGFNSGSVEIAIAPSNAGTFPNAVYVRNVGNLGAITTLTGTGATITDNTTWHQVVVTNVAGGAMTLYVDGVLVQSSTGQTVGTSTTNATYLQVGGTDGTSLSANSTIDEVNIYTKVLTQTRISAHYTAGAAAAGVNINVTAPVATASGSMPVATVVGGKTVSVVAPVASASAAMPNATVTAVDYLKNRSFTALADRRSNGGGTAASITATNTTSVYMNFNPFQPGLKITNAKLRVYTTGSNGVEFFVDKITQTWSEAGTTSVTTTQIQNAPIGVVSNNNYIEVSLAPYIAAWNASPGTFYGVSLTSNSTNSVTFATKESANPPYMVVDYEETGQIDSDNTVVGASLAAAAMPDAEIKTGIKIIAPVMGSSANIPAPLVEAIINPNALVSVPALLATGVALDAEVVAGSDVVITASPMTAAAAEQNAVATNQTDRNIFAPAMTSKARAVGIYSKEDDRYLNLLPGTVDPDDTWYQLDEQSGTVAIDSIATLPSVIGFQNNGEYIGNPELAVEGPYLRRAARFDGVDDYLRVYHYANVGATTDGTLEFSIRTTKLNGTIVTGGGYASNTLPTNLNAPEIRVTNGELEIVTDVSYKVRKFIADGEWHHIVLSMPSTGLGSGFSNSLGWNSSRPFFMQIDGQTEWVRYNAQLFAGQIAPSAMMARLRIQNTITTVSNYLAGELSNVVFRHNYAVSEATAERLYYEWSQALLVDAPVARASATMPNPKVEGNAKKMLVIYGLPHTLSQFAPYTQINVYRNIMAGYVIPGAGGTALFRTNLTDPSGSFPPVTPFRLGEYFVYPVGITGGSDSNTDGGVVTSAPGTINKEFADPVKGWYIDDRTGLLRLFDPGKDLSTDVTDYDVITVVNYPAPAPFDASQPTVVANAWQKDFQQPNYNLTLTQWQTMRDNFRDGILRAASRGCGLFITDAEMALHLGFIKGYDIHSTGRQYNGGDSDFGYTYSLGTNPALRNIEGWKVDRAHMAGGSVNDAPIFNGNYSPVWQANHARRVVATEPGLTDIPSYLITDKIEFDSRDRHDGYADVSAYDVAYKQELVIGDEVYIDMWDEYSNPQFHGESHLIGWPRNKMISAKSEGVIGKVITKEQETYFGGGGVEIDNKFKNNAITIIVERGTVVRGVPLGGRVFIELMDTQTLETQIAVDRYPDMWNGTRNRFVTSWSYDSRRNLPFSIGNPVAPVVDYVPFVSMNMRGLRWLTDIDETPAGDVKIYAPAFESTGQVAVATHSQGRSITVEAPVARAYGELRQPLNFRGPNTEVNARPFEASGEMKGIGTVVNASPMTATATMPGASVLGEIEKIYVYLDVTRNVTLYLKEE